MAATHRFGEPQDQLGAHPPIDSETRPLVERGSGLIKNRHSLTCTKDQVWVFYLFCLLPELSFLFFCPDVFLLSEVERFFFPAMFTALAVSELLAAVPLTPAGSCNKAHFGGRGHSRALGIS